ncbi:MAG: helix-turn-helix transcriptional regulator [Lachnospiraceae bacterium]|nr:helix-turn-helix transcriptional regulator [Lachnospiraceae bacterium]
MARRFKKPTGKFDAGKFTELVKKAIGDRTQKQFSEDTGLSIYYINRLINGKIDNAPRPNTISIIAAVAQNGVTSTELLKAAGYGKDDGIAYEATDEYTSKVRLVSPERERFVRLGAATIGAALGPCKCTYYVESIADSIEYDLVIHVGIDEDMFRWQYQFLLEMPPKRSDTRSIGLVYFHKANESVKPIDVSIIQTYVTESEELYNAILQNVPATSEYSSVMLIDPNRLEILRADLLKGSSNDSRLRLFYRYPETDESK